MKKFYSTIPWIIVAALVAFIFVRKGPAETADEPVAEQVEEPKEKFVIEPDQTLFNERGWLVITYEDNIVLAGRPSLEEGGALGLITIGYYCDNPRSPWVVLHHRSLTYSTVQTLPVRISSVRGIHQVRSDRRGDSGKPTYVLTKEASEMTESLFEEDSLMIEFKLGGERTITFGADGFTAARETIREACKG